MSRIKKNFIIFLPKTYSKDYMSMEEIYSERVADSCPEIQTEIFNKIPKKFYSAEKWITCTNLKCWNCSLNFDNVPIFIPVNIEPQAKEEPTDLGIVMDVHGNFCSFACASAWIQTMYKNTDQWQYMEYLLKLYTIITGKNINKIFPSECKTNMICYGGNLATEDYVKKNKIIEQSYNMDQSDIEDILVT